MAIGRVILWCGVVSGPVVLWCEPWFVYRSSQSPREGHRTAYAPHRQPWACVVSPADPLHVASVSGDALPRAAPRRGSLERFTVSHDPGHLRSLRRGGKALLRTPRAHIQTRCSAIPGRGGDRGRGEGRSWPHPPGRGHPLLPGCGDGIDSSGSSLFEDASSSSNWLLKYDDLDMEEQLVCHTSLSSWVFMAAGTVPSVHRSPGEQRMPTAVGCGAPPPPHRCLGSDLNGSTPAEGIGHDVPANRVGASTPLG